MYSKYLHKDIGIYTVPPESTEVLPRPICRLKPRSHLGKDAVCQNFTEVLPRFAAAYDTVVKSWIG